MENGNRKCIVKDYFYNIYYNGRDSYGSNLSDAKIYGENEIPDNLKNNHKNEIIFLDTERGLELILEEIENLPHKIEQEEDKDEIKRMKEGLERLYNSNPEMIDKYNSQHAKYPSISAFSPERRRLIIREIVSGKSIILE